MTDVMDQIALDVETPRSLPLLLDRFSDLVDQHTGAIGRVVASEKEPSGAHVFHFWASDTARSVDVGHIVVAFSEDAAIIGVVDEPRRYSDLRSFLDDYFDRRLEEALADEPPTQRPEILVYSVNVLATRHVRDDVDSNRPAVAGPIYFATSAAIADALGSKEFDGPAIPALLHVNGNAERDENGGEKRDDENRIIFQRSPVWLDSHYLLGPEAGHGNWTGQSGLATKTSHVQFLTSAVFQRMRQEGQSVAALMFNVKGADLLWMDKPAIAPPGLETRYAVANADGFSERDLEAYEALGLSPEPFSNLRIYAPFRPGQEPTDDTVRFESNRYQQYLNTLRDNRAHNHNIYPILMQFNEILQEPHRLFDRADLDDKLLAFIFEIKSERISTLNDLLALKATIDRHFGGDEDGKIPSEWRNHHPATINKAWNRLLGLRGKFGGLLANGRVDYGNVPNVTSPFSDQEVRVIDISKCNSAVQSMLVTRTVRQVWNYAEEGKLNVDHLIIFVDELNKYAEAGSEGTLRDTLVDIAARGRHLNVVLFGAQQFRSKVDDEILGNCGTSFYGRVGDEEIINSAYRSLSDTARAELLGLKKGRLLVHHAHFRTPVFGTFPRPPVIGGTAGQRVFNDPDNATAGGVVGESIYRLVKRYGDSVTLNQVANTCAGLTSADESHIAQQLEPELRRVSATSASTRLTPWKMAEHYVRKYREQGIRIVK